MLLRLMLAVAALLSAGAAHAETPEAAKAALKGFYEAGKTRGERPETAVSARLKALLDAPGRPALSPDSPFLGGADKGVADVKLSDPLFSAGRMMIVADFKNGEDGHLIVFSFAEEGEGAAKTWVLDEAASLGGAEPFVLSTLLKPAPKLEFNRVSVPDAAPAPSEAAPASPVTTAPAPAAETSPALAVPAIAPPAWAEGLAGPIPAPALSMPAAAAPPSAVPAAPAPATPPRDGTEIMPEGTR